jgi:8-amino-7-oxononanoate synthase
VTFHVKQGTPPGLGFLDDALASAARSNLLRIRRAPGSAGPSFSSNDYLGLAARVLAGHPVGCGASRLISGEREEHVALERAAADLVGQPEALAFTSGYAANVGLLSSLARPGDLVVSDALNHASIIDGIRLSRARTAIVPHLDLGAVESALRGGHDGRSGRAFVVTESYFSMDADAPDLRALRAVCDAHGAALIVDEAHALGALGPEGRGLCAQAGVVPDAVVGTFGKSFGAAGAFVAGCPALVSWLWNRARSFVFSTGMSPAVAAAALDGMLVAQREPVRRERLAAAASQLRAGLAALGVQARGFGHIVPWVVGDARDAVDLAAALQAAGVDARAIRPPSVPPGTARIRLTVTALHSPNDIERAVAAFARLRAGGPPWPAG